MGFSSNVHFYACVRILIPLHFQSGIENGCILPNIFQNKSCIVYFDLAMLGIRKDSFSDYARH
ncbi:hypothetical protein L0222_00810, partial [bacterium]|nr:hypothetical protein [bacterium]